MHSGQFNLGDEFNTSEDLKVHKSPSHVGYCILILFLPDILQIPHLVLYVINNVLS